MMNEHGKSDRPIVPGKSSNKARTSAAEEMEGRGLAKMKRLIRRWLASGTYLSSLSLAPFARYYLRQEPYGGNPLVRIRAGGTEQSVSLPRHG